RGGGGVIGAARTPADRAGATSSLRVLWVGDRPDWLDRVDEAEVEHASGARDAVAALGDGRPAPDVLHLRCSSTGEIERIAARANGSATVLDAHRALAAARGGARAAAACDAVVVHERETEAALLEREPG